MGLTQCYKILSAHLVDGELRTGESIKIGIDQTLTQDATGTMAYLEFESMGIDKVRNELALSYVDHNTLQSGFENADDHKYLQTVAARHGVNSDAEAGATDIFCRPALACALTLCYTGKRFVQRTAQAVKETGAGGCRQRNACQDK